MIEIEKKLEHVRKEIAEKSEELKRLKGQEKALKKLLKDVNKVLGKTPPACGSPDQNPG